MKVYVHFNRIAGVVAAYSSLESAISSVACLLGKHGSAIKVYIDDQEYGLFLNDNCKIERSKLNREQLKLMRRLIRYDNKSVRCVYIRVDRDEWIVFTTVNDSPTYKIQV